MLKGMTNLYPLKKTICFELRPIGKTLEHFNKDKILEKAESRAEEYKEKIKHLIDPIHKQIIEESFKSLSENKEFTNLLREYAFTSNVKNTKQPKGLDIVKIQKNQENKYDIVKIVKYTLINNEKYSLIFSDKKMAMLKEFYKEDNKKIELISHFDEFSSYFKKYDERIKNLCECEGNISKNYKSILYRLINDNLPIFYFNTLRLADITKAIKIVLPDANIKYIYKFSLYLTNSSIKKYNRLIGKINEVISNYNIKNPNNKLSHLGKLGFLVDFNQNSDLLKRISDDKELVEIINKFIDGQKFENLKEIFSNLENKDNVYVRINGKDFEEILRKIGFNVKLMRTYESLDFIDKNDKNKENRNKGRIYEAIQKKIYELITDYSQKYDELKPILSAEYVSEINILSKNSNNIVKIKEFLESIKAIYDFVSRFIPKKAEPKKAENRDNIDYEKVNFDIYNEINFERLSIINQIFNHVKDYFTLKNFSTKKIRLNFEVGQFLNTWDINKIDDTLGTILLKEEEGKTKYFLAILNKTNYSKFEYTEEAENNYKQMIYKNVSKSEEDKEYKISFKYINSAKIDEMVERDQMYLFQIYNKDFSSYSNGNYKLQTIYWNNIFALDNIEKNIFNINGEATIFFRPKSLERKETHKKNEVLKNKNKNNPKINSVFEYPLIKDKRYTEDKLMLHIPIIINYRSKNINQKILNTKINEKIKIIKEVNVIGISRGRNGLVYATVVNTKGEILEQNNLGKITNNVFDKANNKVKEKIISDYKIMLCEKEEEREKADITNDILNEWKFERGIRDVKNGYISQIVNVIVNLVKKYNAIVVFEDLDDKKSERVESKIEKPIYRKIQNAVTAKLSYFINKKESDKTAEGSILNGYQLTYYDEKDDSKEILKQNGIVFYVPTNMTSGIEPKTGFINYFSPYLKRDLSKGKHCDDIKDFFERFEDIRFNEKEGYYEFLINYDRFIYIDPNNKELGRLIYISTNFIDIIEKLYKKEWILCSYGDRIEENEDRKTGEVTYKNVNLTEEFQQLFAKYNIGQGKKLKTNIKKFLETSLIRSIPAKDKHMAKLMNQHQKTPQEEFCREFMRLFALILKLKNSYSNKESYIISPVKDSDGKFFDSRKHNNYSSIVPENEISNSAYNIARKGLLIINRIKETKELKGIDLHVKDEDWLNFVQNGK